MKKIQEFRILLNAASLLTKVVKGTLSYAETVDVMIITDYLNQKYNSTHSHIEMIEYLKCE